MILASLCVLSVLIESIVEGKLVQWDEIDSEDESYRDYEIVRVWVANDTEITDHVNTIITRDEVEVVARGADNTLDLIVLPGSDAVTELMQAGARVEVLHQNMVTFLDGVDNLMTCDLSSIEKRSSTAYDFNKFFKCYQDVESQHKFLQKLAAAHPDKAETFSIGKSYQDRDLLAIRISNNLRNSGNKPMVWIDANIHGREWVSSATALWVAGSLLGEVDNLQTGPFLDKYQFVILPMANPDGYTYSRMSRFTRFWRKTRSHTGCKIISDGLCKTLKNYKGVWCRGVDPNRNFDAAFGTAGTTPNDLCSDTYPGTAPFTENNTQAIRDYITANVNKMRLYLSYHSYSQLFLRPLGWREVLSRDSNLHFTTAHAYVDAVRNTHGKVYEQMVSRDLYPNSGSSADWTYLQGVTHSYTVELRDTGEHLFFLPKSEIKPCGEENVRGLLAVLEII